MVVGISDALSLGDHDVVAIVGAGGKTTALRWLAEERAAAKEQVIMTTTTKIEPQPGLRTVFVSGPGDIAILAGPWPVLVVTEDLGTRLRGVPPEWIDSLAGRSFRLLAHCDYSARRTFKAPGPDEPVIPTSANMVVHVVGSDVIGAPLDAVRVQRPERVGELTGLELGQPVTAETILEVLLDAEGGGRGVPVEARRSTILNKTETEYLWQMARRIGTTLGARGIPTFAGSLRARSLELVG